MILMVFLVLIVFDGFHCFACLLATFPGFDCSEYLDCFAVIAVGFRDCPRLAGFDGFLVFVVCLLVGCFSRV